MNISFGSNFLIDCYDAKQCNYLQTRLEGSKKIQNEQKLLYISPTDKESIQKISLAVADVFEKILPGSREEMQKVSKSHLEDKLAEHAIKIDLDQIG